MARGWESKGVEEQMEAASLEQGRAAPSPRDAAALERERNRALLELARLQAQHALERSTTSAYRSMLQRALADLERRLDELD